MLLATPCVPYDTPAPAAGPPRIISEIRKVSPAKPREQIRPRISGDLLVIRSDEKCWSPRRVVVRGGQLFVGSNCSDCGFPGGPSSASSFRLPLRHLSLAAGPLPNSLALYKGRSIVLTIQTANERAFDLWVKTIAIELIRQTPLEAVRYLDILNLTEQRHDTKRHIDAEPPDHRKDCNHNYVAQRPHDNAHVVGQRARKATGVSSVGTGDLLGTSDLLGPDVSAPSAPAMARPPVIVTAATITPVTHAVPPPTTAATAASTPPKLDEVNVEVLLKKCQNSDSYVPVREKLVLFESLCRLGRKVRSSEDVSYKLGKPESPSKRAASMHDISSCAGGSGGVVGHQHHHHPFTGVKQICRYFENKTVDGTTPTAGPTSTTITTTTSSGYVKMNSMRLINSDSQLHTARSAYGLR